MIRDADVAPELRIPSTWLHADARGVLGVLGRRAQVFNVYSVGDSGEGCEVIEFVVPSSRGPVPWTARIVVSDGRRCAACTLGWAS